MQRLYWHECSMFFFSYGMTLWKKGVNHHLTYFVLFHVVSGMPVITDWSSPILFGFGCFTCCFMENVGGSCSISGGIFVVVCFFLKLLFYLFILIMPQFTNMLATIWIRNTSCFIYMLTQWGRCERRTETAQVRKTRGTWWAPILIVKLRSRNQS